MTKDNEKLESLTEAASFIKELREFAITVGEDCPEGHRRDPASGRCLPIGGQDHTAYTRSLNDEQGPEWRGEVVREDNDQQLASANTEIAVDAEEMDQPESCAEGTVFSFMQRRCVSQEEAEVENLSDAALEEDEEDAAAPGSGGHPEIVQMQPEGRRDTVNHDCPPNMMFDFVLRKCIPLNKDTQMASEHAAALTDEEKQELGRHLHGKVAMTTPDPLDSHTHLATLDKEGNGNTSISGYGEEAHSHEVAGYVVKDHKAGKYTSQHFGHALPQEVYEYGEGEECDAPVRAEEGDGNKFASLSTIEGVEFGLPSKKLFPLDTKEQAEQVMSTYDQLKGDLTPAEQTTLLHNLTIAASRYNIADAYMNLPTITATPDWFTQVFKKEFTRMVASLEEEETEEAAPIKGEERNALPDSAFGVPGKRKFPLDTCNRVRNAMARFNQAKGLTSSEKATLRRKIVARAKACSIEIQNFAKATTEAEFAQVVVDLRRAQAAEVKETIEERYSAPEESNHQGPCPPGMVWDSAQKRCGHTQGFVEKIKANHSEIIAKQPEGRRDTVGHQCPAGQFFDYGQRKCLPLDPSQKEGTTTEKAERDLAPQPAGRPVRLPIDCPKDTIWNKDRNECIPLDSSKKTKSEEEEAGLPPFIQKMLDKKKGKDGDDDKKKKKDKKGKKGNPFGKKSKSEEDEDAQTTPVGPGKEKDDHGCDTATETYDTEEEKCVKSRTAKADNREGLVPPPAGQVNLPSDCPPDTAWDAKLKICRPIDSMDKNRPSGASPESPTSTAEDLEELTPARIIQELDRILSERDETQSKTRVDAKDLPNAAFPPSTVSAEKRALMHHTPAVEDPYDTESVDIGRLRNALARASKVEGFSEKAIEDAFDHLLYHAREVVTAARAKKE
jgi:hypothetical protein